MTSNDYREPVSSALLVSAAPSMMLGADQQAFAATTYQQQMSNLALVSSPVNNARRPKPTNEKLSTVKSGGVHKSKPSTSSISSSSTMGNQRNASHSDGDSDHSAHASDSEPQEQRRRRRFLERNRVAASKCRQKKKMWVQELERRAEDVTMQNRSLHIAVAQLKEEVMILKNQLLAHRNCNCSAIHQYLQAECATDVSGAPLMSHAPVNPMVAPLLVPQAPQAPQGPIMMQQGPPHGQMIIPPQHFRNPPVYASHAHHSSVDMAIAPTIISSAAPPAPAHAPSASPHQ
ncbi:hypothetical protein GGH96_000266 [Coemansia sp. RSA 1972]|nr:hypothetical protein GGH96_000266 [Coemansia sp. RSA 1972]